MMSMVDTPPPQLSARWVPSLGGMISQSLAVVLFEGWRCGEVCMFPFIILQFYFLFSWQIKPQTQACQNRIGQLSRISVTKWTLIPMGKVTSHTQPAPTGTSDCACLCFSGLFYIAQALFPFYLPPWSIECVIFLEIANLYSFPKKKKFVTQLS